jgi:hypothetical protein
MDHAQVATAGGSYHGDDGGEDRLETNTTDALDFDRDFEVVSDRDVEGGGEPAVERGGLETNTMDVLDFDGDFEVASDWDMEGREEPAVENESMAIQRSEGVAVGTFLVRIRIFYNRYARVHSADVVVQAERDELHEEAILRALGKEGDFWVSFGNGNYQSELTWR